MPLIARTTLAAVLAALLPALAGPAAAQSACKRYQAFEGYWQGTIDDEKVEHRYPERMLDVPSRFDADHRKLDIVWRETYYEVSWNSVEGENVPSLRERAQIGEDADGYCQRVRQQSRLAPALPGLRVNIEGSYDNLGVAVRFRTRMCCFLYQPAAMSCVGATHYRTAAYDEERAWYDGLWYTTMTRRPRPNDCEP